MEKPASTVTAPGKRPLVIFALILLCTLPSLWAGLMGDDYMHYAIFSAKNMPIEKPDDLSLFGLFSFINGDPERNRQAMDLGVIPWWTYGGMKYAFWRPLSEITHWVDHQLWPRTPALMHLQNVLWYLGLCFIVFKLFRRTLIPASVAVLGLALYGLDSSHGFAVSWIANRNGILSAFFGMASFYCFMRWRETLALSWQAGSLALMLCSLLAAELGISTFGYLGAYALCCDPKGRIKGVLACLPHFLVIIVWWLVYKSSGFGAANADAYYVDPAAHPLTFLTLFLQRYPVLLASQWGIIPAEIYGYSSQQSIGFVIGCAIFLVIILPFIIATSIRNRHLQMWLLGMLFSLVPATSALPQDRVLTFTGIGASAVLAHFLYAVFKTQDKIGFFPRWSAKTIAGLLVLLHLVLSPLLLPVASYSTKIFWSSLISHKPSEFPTVSDIENKRLVIVGAPLASALAIAPFRFYRGDPIPQRIWLLSSLDQDIHFSRKNEQEIELALESGFIQGAEMNVRDFKRYPFTSGETIPLGGMTISIGALNDKGMPTKLTLKFEQSVDNSNLVFLRWDKKTESYHEIQIK